MNDKETNGFDDDCRELLDDFSKETYFLLATLEREILEIAEKACGERFFASILNIIHTIKGTSACLKLDKIADFCHEYESSIKEIEEGKIKCDNKAIEILLKKFNFLKMACLDVGEKGSSFGEIKRFGKEIQMEDEEPSLKKMYLEKDNVSVPIDDFEKFLKIGEEAMVLHDTIVKLIKKIRNGGCWNPSLEIIQERIMDLGSQLLKGQRQMTEMKKIPMCRVFEPLKKFVRDYAGRNDKKVEMRVFGEALLVDFHIGKMLGNILVHIVNNSLAHGVERVDVRRKRGKPECGTISIRCHERGGKIIVEAEDDGGGLDREKIIACAVSKKNFDKKVLDSMKEEDLLKIVFEPGFSTGEKITGISGHGIGMASVKSSVEKMNGNIELHSHPCKGCIVKIAVPVLAPEEIVKSINVKVSGNYYSIPSDDIFEIINCNDDDREDMIIHEVVGGWVLGYCGRLVPLVHLGQYLNSTGKHSADIENIVVIKSESYFYGLVVDNVDEMEERVVKKIKGSVHDKAYYLGGALTEGGEISLVLDVDEIGKDCKIKKYDGGARSNICENVVSVRYMLFDLKGHKNYVVSLSDVFRIESIEADDIDCMEDVAAVPYQNKKMTLIWVERALNLCEKKDLISYIDQCRYLNILVIKWGQEYFGLIVDKIKGIEETPLEMDAGISDRKGIAGVVVFENKIASVVDMEFLLEDWLQNFDRHKSLVA